MKGSLIRGEIIPSDDGANVADWIKEMLFPDVGATMQYLSPERLAQIAPADFQRQKPFPWLNISEFLTAEAFELLLDNLPDISLFHREFGRKRGYGQNSHDRFVLQYRDGIEIPFVWQQFISELRGPAYQEFIARMFALRADERFVLTMHWHYAAAGCGVSPHVDASRKLGSHIFYWHRNQSWDPEWGGQTLVLDDGGRFSAHSAPSFEELSEVAASQILDNQSFIFKRTDNSWHGVRPLNCPDGELRKVFIVVINRMTFQVRWRQWRGKDPDGYPLQVKARA